MVKVRTVLQQSSALGMKSGSGAVQLTLVSRQVVKSRAKQGSSRSREFVK